MNFFDECNHIKCILREVKTIEDLNKYRDDPNKWIIYGNKVYEIVKFSQSNIYEYNKDNIYQDDSGDLILNFVTLSRDFEEILDYFHTKDKDTIIENVVVQEKSMDDLAFLKVNPNFLRNLDKDIIVKLIDICGKVGLKMVSTYSVNNIELIELKGNKKDVSAIKKYIKRIL